MAEHIVKFVAWSKDKVALYYDISGKKKEQELIWGDEVHILEDGEFWFDPAPKPDDSASWVYARSRGHEGWIKEEDLQDNGILDIIFVDVGQGDACLISLPDRRKVMVDAGQYANMYSYLCWRFSDRDIFNGIESAVISHGDKDHYFGLQAILDDKKGLFGGNKAIGKLYHNGIVTDRDPITIAKEKYVQPTQTAEELSKINDDSKELGYPGILRKAQDSGIAVKMAYAEPDKASYLQGFDQGDVKIEVMAPIAARSNEQINLPWYGGKKLFGKTKNGNSVVLKLVYDDIIILLTGDLHAKAHEYLMKCCTDKALPKDAGELQNYIIKCKDKWQCDVTKWSHHGSADFSDAFLAAVSPCVTVVSSGDNEDYCHPRPDTLGAIGKCSRGQRPAIFSTELARSVTPPKAAKRDMKKANQLLAEGELSEDDQKKRDKQMDGLGRTIAVYGAINLRTDGRRLMMVQKREAKNSWAKFNFERDESGTFVITK